ncbi:MAG: hypothetical protein C9356_04315 [Oleiphilus sp.]|nr:MAG: hypothetical protein C9356_04315 [Oleiphilus sp.]
MILQKLRGPQQGLSLIELMVAMALSLTLMAGVFQIFLSNKKSFEITRDLSDVQENGRLGLTFVGESVRMADHWGSIEGGDLTLSGTSVNAVAGDCNSAWILDTSTAIEGFDGGAAAPVSCIENATENYMPNTDVLVVRYADARQQIAEADLASVGNDDIIVRVSAAEEGRLFEGANESSATAAIPFDDQVFNFPFMAELYYVRNCSILGAGGKCDSAVDDTPTLVRMTLNGKNFQEQPLVEGVEYLQFDYGIDTDNDLIADTYVTADDLGDAVLNDSDDWDDVLSVRMSLISRATQIDNQVDDNNTYVMVDGGNYVAAAADRKYRRKQYNREIHLRNRSRL